MSDQVVEKEMVNERITSRSVRLVHDDGREAEVISTFEAVNIAYREGKDLVVINPNQTPPIAKILDYGKFKYEKSIREKDQARKSRASQVLMKEIQLRLVTDKNDIAIKAKKASKFLSDGNKVKIMIKFRGRELSHPELGFEVLNTFMSHLPEHKVEKPGSLNGRDMIAIVSPK